MGYWYDPEQYIFNKMKQIQIEEYICKPPISHGYARRGCGHFAAGESKCRKCEIYLKVEYKSNLCPICHNRISRHRRYAGHHKYENVQ